MKIIGRIGVSILLSLLLAWAVLFLSYFGNVLWKQFKGERNVSHFLKAVQQQHYDEAVSRFGEPLNKESLKQLQPFRLVKYGRINADFDDGCVCSGHAELTFQAKGAPITVPALFTLREGNKPGQICALMTKEQRASMPQLAQWNIVVCGSDSF
ncbi:hypothetical protein PALU110988_00580 [Paenibacillus lupini]